MSRYGRWSRARGQRPVVLTYDDGPEPGGTDVVLKVLAEHGVTATFFVLLSRTRRYPGLLSEVLAAGHEIGLHGVDHQRLTTLDPAHVAQRTADARHELEDTIGREVRWFRPPYGGQSIGTWQAICGTGLTPVVWTADLRDWMEITDDERLSGVRELTQPGAIILAHDGFATAADGASGRRPAAHRPGPAQPGADRHLPGEGIHPRQPRPGAGRRPARDTGLAGLTPRRRGTPDCAA